MTVESEAIRRFGRALHAWLHDESWRGGWSWVLGGWTDGSCHLLAHTLSDWLGGRAQLVTVVIPAYERIPQHMAVRLDGWLLDGDGATLEQAFVERWQILADLYHRGLRPAARRIDVVPFAERHARAAYEHGMCRSRGAVEGFARDFVRAFGTPGDWGLA